MSEKTVIYQIKLKDISGDATGKLKKQLEGLGATVEVVNKQTEDLKTKFLNFNQFVSSIQHITDAIGQVSSTMNTLTGFYASQVEVESKLQTVMRNTMNATDAEVQAIKDLCSAQQELGVIGDEVQLAGAQELATYMSKKESLAELIPVMNDIIAQQYGFNATQESAVNIATMMGKVFAGQVSALSRYGYTFDETQEKILKFGTEEQKAATLAEVVRQSVGNVNAELAKTDAGRMVQLNNTIGDIKEQVGQMLMPFQALITQAAELGVAAGGLIQLTQAIRATGIATKAWTAAQWLLNAALEANPVGLLVTALAAIVAGLIYAYHHSESFRRVVDEAWAAVKVLAEVLWKVLGKAIEWLIKSFKDVVAWLKEFARWFANTKLASGIMKFHNLIKENVLKVFDKIVAGVRKVAEWLGKVFDIQIGGGAMDAYYEALDLTNQFLQKTKEAAKAKENLFGGGFSASGDGKGKKKQEEEVFDPDTIGYFQQKISELQKQQRAADTEHAIELQRQINLLQRQLELKESYINMKGSDFKNEVLKASPLPATNKIAGQGGALNLPVKFDTGALARAAEEIRKRSGKMLPPGAVFEGVSKSISAVAGVMGGLRDVVGEAAAAWIDWGQNLLQAIAAAIPQIAALTTAEQERGNASMYSAGTGAASAVSSIPFVGPILAIAAVASVLAAIASIPRYAEGGIAYGKTIGMFGEYANASTNPEVVAPLSKLRDLIEPSGGVGQVVFRISGRDLEGVLNKRSQVNRRTR